MMMVTMILLPPPLLPLALLTTMAALVLVVVVDGAHDGWADRPYVLVGRSGCGARSRVRMRCAKQWRREAMRCVCSGVR